MVLTPEDDAAVAAAAAVEPPSQEPPSQELTRVRSHDRHSLAHSGTPALHPSTRWCHPGLTGTLPPFPPFPPLPYLPQPHSSTDARRPDWPPDHIHCLCRCLRNVWPASPDPSSARPKLAFISTWGSGTRIDHGTHARTHPSPSAGARQRSWRYRSSRRTSRPKPLGLRRSRTSQCRCPPHPAAKRRRHRTSQSLSLSLFLSLSLLPLSTSKHCGPTGP